MKSQWQVKERGSGVLPLQDHLSSHGKNALGRVLPPRRFARAVLDEVDLQGGKRRA